MNWSAPARPLSADKASSTWRRQFSADLGRGMASSPKTIPSKYFYDERGSRLFDRITQLPEYYLTRTELEIMSTNIDSIAACLRSKVVLIEYGSGSSLKTRMVLDHLESGSAYVPIDISGKYLRRIAADLENDYPHLDVVPVHADYSEPVVLPPLSGRRIVYYPGSTIGNFEPAAARDFLRRMRSVVGETGAVLLGVDLQKDPETLIAAYDDPQGVTALFNKNIMQRANDELGTDFDVDAYRHRAYYDAEKGRVEMHLVVSGSDQYVNVNGSTVHIATNEYIHTENSYKFTLEGLASLASDAGFAVNQTWLDGRQWFCVAFLTATSI